MINRFTRTDSLIIAVGFAIMILAAVAAILYANGASDPCRTDTMRLERCAR
jgi:hypothetical protein